MTGYSIAIVGATGLVGTTLLSLLEERDFPISKLYLIASQQSTGKELLFRGTRHPIHDLATFDFHQTKIVFFCVGNQLAEQFVPKAVSCGNIVIDKSSYFRNQADIPLLVPEVNMHTLDHYQQKKLIANPNCMALPIAVALKPIYDAVGIKRINVATYQSVSGTGKDAVTELSEQTAQLLNDQPIQPKVYSQQIAFNVLPHIDQFHENGYTGEEMKIIQELQKIFDNPELAVNPTAVRVPVFCGHAAAVHIETKEKITVERAIQLLSQAPSVKLITGEYPYPTPVQNAAGSDFVYVGRIREDISHGKGLNLWIVADNLRKGAALNAVQIAEYLIKHRLSS